MTCGGTRLLGPLYEAVGAANPTHPLTQNPGVGGAFAAKRDGNARCVSCLTFGTPMRLQRVALPDLALLGSVDVDIVGMREVMRIPVGQVPTRNITAVLPY